LRRWRPGAAHYFVFDPIGGGFATLIRRGELAAGVIRIAAGSSGCAAILQGVRGQSDTSMSIGTPHAPFAKIRWRNIAPDQSGGLGVPSSNLGASTNKTLS
jgi:hypothetical protein